MDKVGVVRDQTKGAAVGPRDSSTLIRNPIAQQSMLRFTQD